MAKAVTASESMEGRSGGASLQRKRLLAWVLPLVVLAAGGGFAASKWIESPADAAARTAPPPPSPILVPVEKRLLSSEIVTRGTGRFGLPQEVAIAPSGLKPAAGLITTLPVLNSQIEEGQVLLTASGRPVFVLGGERPAYRDITPGTEGRDVQQLEAALQRLGFDPGVVDGVFDEQTGAAIGAWYAAGGWQPFGPTPAQVAQVRNIEREFQGAQKGHLAALAAADSAAFEVEAARAAAEQDNRLAEADLAAKFVDQRSQGAQPVADSLKIESERARSMFSVRAAQAELDAAIAERALIVLDPRQPEQARNAADAKLALAQASLERARLEGELAVSTAERDLQLRAVQYELAKTALNSTRLAGEVKVRQALSAKKVADLDVQFAASQVERLAEDLERARRRQGVQVPVDEVVFIPALPVRVHELIAAVGQEARGPLLSVTDNQLSIDSSLTLEAAPLVKPGMPVTIDEQALGIKAKGVVATVANTPGTRGVDGYHVYFEVRVTETSGPLAGVSTRLTLPIRSTGDAVTAVPVSALTLSGDGSSRVQVQTEAGLEFLAVEPGMSADGFVEVVPVNGTLEAGQLVLVGYEQPE